MFARYVIFEPAEELLPFEVAFVDPGGSQRREVLSAGLRFEEGLPVRSFRWSRRLGHFPGWWWAAATGTHVGYESWLERDHLMLLDFEPEVVAVASQPFWLYWSDAGGGSRRHAPDFFARLAGGGGVVVDVRAVDRIEPADAEAFAATARACAQVGWEYRQVGVVDPVLVTNVRWLSRYRHPRHAGAGEVVRGLRKVFIESMPLRAGAAEVGDPLAVLPALFHLIWRQELVADLKTRLGASTLVWCADRAGSGR